MNLKLKENFPYVFIFMVESFAMNHCLHIHASWLQIASWIPTFYMILWFYQTYAPKRQEFSIYKALTRNCYEMGFMIILAIAIHYYYYHSLSFLIIASYILIGFSAPVILDRSLYD